MTTGRGVGEVPVRLIPLGVGDAFSARHYTTCMALGAGDDWLLIDCPHPVRKMLREASEAAGVAIDLDAVVGVALSHLHADHASGLEDFAYYSKFALGRRARLAAHPDVLARLWPNLLAAGMDRAVLTLDGEPTSMTRDDYFDATELATDPSATVAFGPFTLACRTTRHPIPTTAFRIDVAGRSIGFSADTAFDPDLIAWLAPCDLILHETTARPASPVHTPYRDLASLPEPLRRKIRLFHYPDDFAPSPGAPTPLRQGELVPILPPAAGA